MKATEVLPYMMTRLSKLKETTTTAEIGKNDTEPLLHNIALLMRSRMCKSILVNSH